MAVGLGLYVGWLTIARAQIRPATPIPYTTIVRSTVYAPDGSVNAGRDTTTAVRSDGARVLRSESRVEPFASSRTINLPSGDEVIVDDIREIKMTTRSPNRSVASVIRDPRSNCLDSLAGSPVLSGQSLLGTETVSGYRTVKMASEKNMTWWFAVDHGCALVKFRAEWGEQGVTEQNLVALIPGEPQPDLFRTPASFREVLPSEFHKNAGNANHGLSAEKLSRMDDWYRQHRP
ncbi:MAG: hypothetical protein U0Q16_08065 [Bryobacteraceae bacterium]